MPRPGLAIIRKTRMSAKFDDVIGRLRSLHGLAIDNGAQKNLKRAIVSTENAARVYQHHNLKGSD